MTPHSDLAGPLAAALARHTGLRGRIGGLRRLTGGATKQTWSFDLEIDGRDVPLILQQVSALPPERGASMPKLDATEDARLMTLARAHGVPAPVVRAVLDDADGLGPGYVTERVDGETLGRKVVSDARYAAGRAPMAAQAGAILAAIHRLPTAELPFLQRLDPAGELRVYDDLLASAGARHAALEFGLQWVRRRLPATCDERVVHADFRTGNLIVGPEGIRCVLDWEIARIGDPMQDLGVLCMRTWRFGGAGPVGGFGARADLYAAYERAGGAPVDPQRVHFWEAFSNIKWAIVCAYRGLTAAADGSPPNVELRMVGRRLEEPLWDFFELIRTET